MGPHRPCGDDLEHSIMGPPSCGIVKSEGQSVVLVIEKWRTEGCVDARKFTQVGWCYTWATVFTPSRWVGHRARPRALGIYYWNWNGNTIWWEIWWRARGSNNYFCVNFDIMSRNNWTWLVTLLFLFSKQALPIRIDNFQEVACFCCFHVLIVLATSVYWMSVSGEASWQCLFVCVIRVQ